MWGFKTRGLGPCEPRRQVKDENADAVGKDFLGGDLADLLLLLWLTFLLIFHLDGLEKGESVHMSLHVLELSQS